MSRRQIVHPNVGLHGWDFFLHWFGRILLLVEIGLFLFWLVSTFVIIPKKAPPPLAPLPGIPLEVYDTLAPFRTSHYRASVHFVSPALLLSLLTGPESELSPWHFFILGIVVGTDLFLLLENAFHLSGVDHPSLHALEMSISIISLIMSTLIFLWFSAAFYQAWQRRKRMQESKRGDDKGEKESEEQQGERLLLTSAIQIPTLAKFSFRGIP